MVKVGINGFSRTGRLFLRAALLNFNDIQVIAINDDTIDVDTMVYLLKYDNMYGSITGTIENREGKLSINGNSIEIYSQAEISTIPWGAAGVEYVVEAAGKYPTTDLAEQHLKGGAKKVIITGIPIDNTPVLVYGINSDKYDKSMHVVSGSSAGLNCLATISRVMNDYYGIREGIATSLHSMLEIQNTLDGSNSYDVRLGRAASANIVPRNTNFASALGKVIPELNGKITGTTLHVPTLDGSAVEFTISTEKPATHAEIAATIKRVAENELLGILGYTADPVVSSYFINSVVSGTFDANASKQLTNNFMKIVCWFGSDWGYVNKLCNLVEYMSEKDRA